MASIDGLITGMSTTDTINQLMKVEAAPQTALKAKITTANKVVSAYQSVNSRLSSIASAAKAAGSADTWGAMKATSNSTAAVVSAQSGAAAGSMSFRVEKLAATHVMTFAAGSVTSATDATGSPAIAGSTFDVTLNDGTTKQLTPSDKSLQAVVAAINGEQNVPYKAAAVQIGPGKYTLQLTAKESGQTAADKFDTAGVPTGLSLGAASITVQGGDAELKVGTTNPYSITSATNTFTGVMPGVTVTATKAQAVDESVTVNVGADADGIAAKIQALVDNTNTALSEIASQSKIKTSEVAAGPLVGDSAIRKLSQDLLGTISSGAAGLGKNGVTASYSEVGVSVDRSGKLTFDKAKFMDAYNADPARTQKFFDSYTDKPGGVAGKFEPGFDVAVGLGRKLEAVSLVASEGVIDPTDPTKAKLGTMQALIQRNTSSIKLLNDQVSEWDIRLDLRKSALEKQFSGLEVALGKMQQQSTWLAGQLAGLA
ncbi:flagellar filament capping protein FliD [Pseudosporangium ferrugineum]|uniref:Flagellar hook-associated protein 2 n=1 Tax=Pseudosporangium ferrugineum TaxID=439699 RepID=A0A2T0S5M8_9ACTN|nr:flagellar filament capping protein FliD [Pseudosporangium ferrugineum]PRY28712.1 flagellar hook-associated protein 2 [Pseudosporangium ferrugineum]